MADTPQLSSSDVEFAPSGLSSSDVEFQQSPQARDEQYYQDFQKLEAPGGPFSDQPARPAIDYSKLPPEVNNAIASVPRPQMKTMDVYGDIPITSATSPMDVTRRDQPQPYSYRRALVGGATDVLTTPEIPEATTAVPPLGPQAAQGAEELATPGKRVRGALRLGATGLEAATPFIGPAAIESPENVARGVAEGYVAGKGAKKIAKVAGAEPETQELAENVGQLGPMVGEAVLRPRLGVATSPEGTAVSAGIRGAGAGVAVTPEETVIRGKVGPIEKEVRIPRNGAKPPEQPALTPQTIEGELAANPPTRDEIADAQAATDYAGPDQAKAAVVAKRQADRAAASAAPPSGPEGAKAAGAVETRPIPSAPAPAASPAKGVIEAPARGVERGERISPDELDSGAWSLYGKEHYTDLKPEQQQSVVASLSKRTTGTSIATPEGRQQTGLEPPTPQLTSADVEMQPERRANVQERKRVDQMTPEEMQQELLTSKVTGLPNRRAYDEAEKPAAAGMSDADGLKAFNDKFGYEAGNALLQAKADALREAGLDAYHDKGDEFLYRGASVNDLNDKLDKAREILRNKEISIELKDGSQRTLKGVDFSYGTGQDLSDAETGLKSHKAEREAKGERARGELRGITETPGGVDNEDQREAGQLKRSEVEVELPPEEKFKHRSTQFNIPEESEAHGALETARQRIADADLAGQGKDIGGNHVTVRYGLTAKDDDELQKLKGYISSLQPFEATLGKTEKFPPSESSDNAAVIHAPIESPELQKINKELENHAPFIEPTFKDYKPHATIAYVKPDKADRYVGMDVTHGKKFKVNSIAITDRNGNQDEVKLEGKGTAAGAAPKFDRRIRSLVSIDNTELMDKLTKTLNEHPELMKRDQMDPDKRVTVVGPNDLWGQHGVVLSLHKFGDEWAIHGDDEYGWGSTMSKKSVERSVRKVFELAKGKKEPLVLNQHAKGVMERRKIQAQENQALKHALTSGQVKEDQWGKLAKSGATDDQIKTKIAEAFNYGIGNGSKFYGGFDAEAPGGEPKFWHHPQRFGPDTQPIKEGSPTLDGQDLIDAARDLFKIPEPEAKRGEPSKVGDHIQVAGIDTILARTETHDEVLYQLFKATRPGEFHAVVRVFDKGAKDVISIKKYPSLQQAEAEYDKTIEKVRPANYKSGDVLKGFTFEGAEKVRSETPYGKPQDVWRAKINGGEMEFFMNPGATEVVAQNEAAKILGQNLNANVPLDRIFTKMPTYGTGAPETKPTPAETKAPVAETKAPETGPGSPEYEKLKARLAQLEKKPAPKPAATSARNAFDQDVAKRVAEKLRATADRLESQIDDARRPMTQNATPKRMAQYRNRLIDADEMERTQKAMRALADAHETGNVPAELADLRSKDEISRLVYKGIDTSKGGYYDRIPRSDYRDTSPKAKLLQNMIEGKSPEATAAKAEKERLNKISQLEADVQFRPIPGFFPTPKAVIDKMLAKAGILPNQRVLEPSAGKGDIADAVRERVPSAELDTAEINGKLGEVLKLKGHKLIASDFLSEAFDNDKGKYDKIVMNPPFEKGQDVEHVRRAYELLKPGGRLVSIMSPHWEFASDRKSADFRTWLQAVGGESEKIENGFKGPGAFRQTGVSSRMVVIDKAARTASPAKSADKSNPEFGQAKRELYPNKAELTDAEVGKVIDRAQEIARLPAVAPPGSTEPVAGVSKVSSAEEQFSKDVKKRADSLRQEIAKLTEQTSAPAAYYQDPAKNAAARDERSRNIKRLSEAEKKLDQIERANPREVKPPADAKLPDRAKNKYAFQRDYFTQALQPVLDAWKAHLGPRFSTAVKEGSKAAKPPDFPERQVLVDIPGDGHFRVNNDPKVLDKVIRGATKGFSNPRVGQGLKATPTRISREASEPAKWSYLERMADEAREGNTQEDKDAAFETIENLLGTTPLKELPEPGTTVSYRGEQYFVNGWESSHSKQVKLIPLDSDVGKQVKKWLEAGRPNLSTAEHAVMQDRARDAQESAPLYLLQHVADAPEATARKTPAKEETAAERLRGESGLFNPSALHPTNIRQEYNKLATEFIGKLGLTKYFNVAKVDKNVADNLNLVDNAPRWAREKAKANLAQVTDGLNEDQIRLASLMVDSDSRDYLHDKKPADYQQAMNDPKVMAAVQRFKPLQDEMAQDRIALHWPVRRSLEVHEDQASEKPWIVTDRDGNPVDSFKSKGQAQHFVETNGTIEPHLKRTYPEHLRSPLPAETGAAPFTGSFYASKGLRPPGMDRKSRLASAEYHYDHGAKDFSGYTESFIKTKEAILKQHLFDDFSSKATPWIAGTAKPPTIEYDGKTYYRPDFALQMRRAETEKSRQPVPGIPGKPPKDVLEYSVYDPSRGERFLIRQLGTEEGEGFSTLTTGKPGIGPHDRFLGPKVVVDALENYDASRGGEGAGKLRKFFQEQIVGLFGPMVHVNNIMRRVGQATGTGTFDPRSWPSLAKVITSPDLRARVLKGVDDETINSLVRRGSYTDWSDIGNLNAYIGGNLNPANWIRYFGKGVLFDPKFLGGWGGLDPKARVIIGDYFKEHYPEMSEKEWTGAVNEGLGEYNRANWSERQRKIARFTLFPGWDFGSFKWFIRHPWVTAMAPAIVTLAVNLALHYMGKNKGDDEYDFGYVHWGDRKFRTGLVTESMAESLASPILRAGEAALKHEDIFAGATEGAERGASNFAGTLAGPTVQMIANQLFNRKFAGSEGEIVQPQDKYEPGTWAPTVELEKRISYTFLKGVPAVNRFMDNKGQFDWMQGLGSIVGTTNYRYGGEERLRANAAKAADLSKALHDMNERDPQATIAFVQNPTRAAYLVFNGDLSQMLKNLKDIDTARARLPHANLSESERKETEKNLDQARKLLLTSADALNEILVRTKLQKPLAASATSSQ